MKTVNFLEAIRSGKRFRPINTEETNWWFFDKHEQLRRFFIKENYDKPLELQKCDYFGEFELEERKVTITESDFNHACVKLDINPFHGEAAKIKKELGF